MFRFNNDAGDAGNGSCFSADDSNGLPNGRGRVQADDFGLPKVWGALGIGYTRFSDEGSNHRSLDQQLLNVLTKAQREGVFVP